MPLNDLFDLRIVGDKRVFIVDDHHKALAAWAVVRRETPTAPDLITIDHHTDTHEAFWGHAYWDANGRQSNDAGSVRERLIAQIDWASDDSVAVAISKLRHDEHIDAATRSDALDNAFCIQLSDSGGTQSREQKAREAAICNEPIWISRSTPISARPMAYDIEPNRIYVLSHDCFVGCEASPHDEECELRLFDEVIDAPYLNDQLIRASEITRSAGLRGAGEGPYILDFDLDVFHTRRSINPRDPSTLYRLIRNATAITVATEKDCVQELWRDELHPMDADHLLAELLRHIDIAQER